MSEPEDLILEGAHFATRLAREVWGKYAPRPQSGGLTLAAMRPRLELFATALFGVRIQIRPLEPPAPLTWLSRLAGRRPSDRRNQIICATDGRGVYLADETRIGRIEEDLADLYRLLTVTQSARLVRQSARACAQLTSTQAQDLFRVADAAIVDGWIAAHAPGLAAILCRARATALARRQHAHRPQTFIERAICDLLASDPAAPSFLPNLPDHASAVQCAGWADETSRALPPQKSHHATDAVFYWGDLLGAEPGLSTTAPGLPEEPRAAPHKSRVTEMRRRPRPRQAADDEDDATSGAWLIRADDPQESVEDPFGLQRPADRDHDADPDGLGDSLSDLPEARVVRTPERPYEVLRSGAQDERSRDALAELASPRAGVCYPEWDYRIAQYRSRGAIVRQPAPARGDPEWAASSLLRHAGLVQRVRTRFERLRPRPLRVYRQKDGSDVDVSAYVTSAADRQAGLAMDDRLYVSSCPARRELAVALLVDASASTDAWVSTNRRIIDVEKDAVLLVCEALDALGDPYALFAFSGQGAEHVGVVPLKSFAEPANAEVHRRIAALDSDGYTRLGAAIRHVTAALCRQRAALRLLLLLSDGKPNDIDIYEGPYGIEDTRQAVAEARRQGVAVFCLTVDREAPHYAERVFNRTGFAVLHKAEQLPRVVVEVLRHFVRV
jgi:nitric oxide reductase NorD protein